MDSMAPPIGPSDFEEYINPAGASGPGSLRRSQTAPGPPNSSTTESYAAVLQKPRPVRKDSQISQCTVTPGPGSRRRFLRSHTDQTPIKGSQTLSDTPGSSCNPFTSGLSATGPSFLPSGGNGVANDSVAGTEWRSGSRSYAGKVAAQKDSGLADRHGPPSSMSYAAALTVTHPAVDLGATPTSPSSRSEVEQTALASSPDGGLPVLQHSHQAHDPNSQNALAIKSYAVALTVSGAAEVKPFGDGVKTHDKKDEPPSGVKDGWSSTCKVTFRRKTAFSS